MMSHHLRRKLRLTWGLAAGLALGGAWISLPEKATAQTVETIHQQRQDQASQVHAQGSGHLPGKPFLDNYKPPQDLSTEGHRINWLFEYTSWVTFGFFVVMATALFYFAYAFRARPGHKAEYSKGKSFWEQTVKWTLDAAVFISLDLVLIWATYKDTAEYFWNYPKGPEVVKVMVMPQQWAWNFKYAGADGEFGTEDDINTINEMRLPKGRPIMIQMKAKDVIHGFLFMEARMQMDAIPGNITKFWFDINKAGEFELACAHMCGTYHYKMKAFIRVMEQEDYAKWTTEASEWSKATFDPEEKSAQWGWKWGI